MAIKYSWLSSGLMIGILLSANVKTLAEESSLTTYLMSGAPTFTQTVKQFEETYNAAHPNYEIPPYQEITRLSKDNVLYFASKINSTLYSSVVVDGQTKKIKSLQLTYVAPAPVTAKIEPETETITQQEIITPALENQAIVIDGDIPVINTSDNVARDYMATLLEWFNPALSHEESKKELDRLLKIGRDDPLYQEIIDNLRYVVVDHGEKGITLAVEPIKQKTPE